MKIRKLLSVVAAAAVATSAMAVSAFAELGEGFDASSGHFICLVSNDSNVPVLKNSALAGDVRTVSLTVKTKSKDFEAAISDGTTWYGGGFGVNSKSNGWKTLGEWSIQEGVKPLTLVPTDTRYVYNITYTSDSAILTADEEYAFFWFQDWTNGATFDITDIKLLNADGVDIRDLDNGTAETPAEETPAEETPAEETPAEETPAEETPAEETPAEESEEPTEESEEAGPDWDSYDLDAATAANEAFVFGESETIDLYAVLGDDLYDLNKVEATFTWTAGTGWCGGGGIGGGIVLDDGSTWVSGPEYGAANANEGVVNDGVATQTVIDLGDASIAEIASVGEDGATSFGALFVQNWWNGVEANAELASLTFYNADGDVIGELVYSEASAPAETPADKPADTNTGAATDNKGNPDTGVAGVAAVAGLAALAGAAVVASRKRK